MRDKLQTIGFILFICTVFHIQATAQSQNYVHKVDSFNTLIENFVRQDSLKLAIKAMQDLTDIYEYEGKWEHYENTVDQMFELAQRVSDKSELLECYNKLGISSNLNGRMKEALQYFQQSLALSEEIKDTLSMANSHENIGITQKDLGNYQEALEHQMKSVELRIGKYPERIPNNYSYISVLFEFLGDYDKQYLYLKKAMEMDKQLPPDHSRSAILCCEMGEYLMDQQKFDTCLIYFKQGLEHCEQIDWKRGIAVFLGDMAEAYKHMGDVHRAIDVHRQSLKLSNELNDCSGMVQEYYFLAELYAEIDRLDSAIILNNIALKKAVECELANEQVNTLEIASTLHESAGNYKRSLDYHKQYLVLHDSLLNIEKQGIMEEMEAKYQTSQKEQQIALLNSENQLHNQRVWLFVAIIALLALAIAVGVLDFLRRKKHTLRKQESLRQQLLRSQMNPHFLFNALGSIQNYMYRNEPKKAAAYLGNFASLTRSILENSTEEFIPLSDEIDTLRNYLELEKLRTKNKFEYQVIHDDELDTEFINIPPMMIQPFVENAIKHGFKEIKDGGQLTLTFSESEDILNVEIADNGVGIEKANSNKPKGHNSMSMKIFEERRRILAGSRKKKVECNIEDIGIEKGEHTGTRVKMTLPIKE